MKEASSSSQTLSSNTRSIDNIDSTTESHQTGSTADSSPKLSLPDLGDSFELRVKDRFSQIKRGNALSADDFSGDSSRRRTSDRGATYANRSALSTKRPFRDRSMLVSSACCPADQGTSTSFHGIAQSQLDQEHSKAEVSPSFSSPMTNKKQRSDRLATETAARPSRCCHSSASLLSNSSRSSVVLRQDHLGPPILPPLTRMFSPANESPEDGKTLQPSSFSRSECEVSQRVSLRSTISEMGDSFSDIFGPAETGSGRVSATTSHGCADVQPSMVPLQSSLERMADDESAYSRSGLNGTRAYVARHATLSEHADSCQTRNNIAIQRQGTEADASRRPTSNSCKGPHLDVPCEGGVIGATADTLASTLTCPPVESTETRRISRSRSSDVTPADHHAVPSGSDDRGLADSIESTLSRRATEEELLHVRRCANRSNLRDDTTVAFEGQPMDATGRSRDLNRLPAFGVSTTTGVADRSWRLLRISEDLAARSGRFMGLSSMDFMTPRRSSDESALDYLRRIVNRDSSLDRLAAEEVESARLLAELRSEPRLRQPRGEGLFPTSSSDFAGDPIALDPRNFVTDDDWYGLDTFEGLMQLASIVGHAQIPIPPSLLNRLPTCEYGAWDGGSCELTDRCSTPEDCKGKGKQKVEMPHRDLMCPVCREDYLDPDLLMSVPVCNHAFHADCLKSWLRTAKTCPLCRSDIFQSLTLSKAATKSLFPSFSIPL